MGREPETAKIGLKELGVQYDKYNHLLVNSKFETAVKGIYAIGDVVSNALELTPVAIKEGNNLATALFKFKKDENRQWKIIDY